MHVRTIHVPIGQLLYCHQSMSPSSQTLSGRCTPIPGIPPMPIPGMPEPAEEARGKRCVLGTSAIAAQGSPIPFSLTLDRRGAVRGRQSKSGCPTGKHIHPCLKHLSMASFGSLGLLAISKLHTWHCNSYDPIKVSAWMYTHTYIHTCGIQHGGTCEQGVLADTN